MDCIQATFFQPPLIGLAPEILEIICWLIQEPKSPQSVETGDVDWVEIGMLAWCSHDTLMMLLQNSGSYVDADMEWLDAREILEKRQ